MPAYKDKKTGLFYVQFYYRDARGAKRHKTKKGFQTELEALLWEKNFKALKDDDRYIHEPRTGDVCRIASGIGSFSCALTAR